MGYFSMVFHGGYVTQRRKEGKAFASSAPQKQKMLLSPRGVHTASTSSETKKKISVSTHREVLHNGNRFRLSFIVVIRQSEQGNKPKYFGRRKEYHPPAVVGSFFRLLVMEGGSENSTNSEVQFRRHYIWHESTTLLLVKRCNTQPHLILVSFVVPNRSKRKEIIMGRQHQNLGCCLVALIVLQLALPALALPQLFNKVAEQGNAIKDS